MNASAYPKQNAGYLAVPALGGVPGQDHAANPSISGTADACYESAQRTAVRLLQLSDRLESKPSNGVGFNPERPAMGIITTLSQTHALLMAIDKEISELERRIFG